MIGRVDTLQGRRVRAYALGTSGLALAMVLATPAHAQCAPDPTITGGTTTCTGTDADGLTITTSGTRVVVDPSATVLGSGGPAIALRMPPSYYYTNTDISIAGRIDGGPRAGIDFLTQTAPGYSYSDQSLAVTVQAGSVVTGSNGIVLAQDTPGYSTASVMLDNAGTITGTDGIALRSTASQYLGFSSIVNRQGGVIGAIAASTGRISNAGTIDGGARSAIDRGRSARSNYYYSDLDNTGTIRSASTTATLVNLPFSRNVTNGGLIINDGTGAVIDSDYITVVNAAGGRIATSGATAIRTSTSLRLTNAGIIQGDIVTAYAPLYFTTESIIDSSAGRIDGSVLFGDGDDTLITGYDNGSLVTGITGTIDGGLGSDRVLVRFKRDATLSAPLVLPTNFDRFDLAPDAGVVTTLGQGFTNFAVVPGFVVSGAGTVVNATQIALAAGQSITTENYGSFVNDGVILAPGNDIDRFAIALSHARRFENTGRIGSNGGGVAVNDVGPFVNSGIIVANGTGISAGGFSFENSGSVQSIERIGVILEGYYGLGWKNSGTIEGRIAGAQIRGGLINTGTIRSTGTGLFVDSSSTLDNRAGGVVTGSTVAIGPQTAGAGGLNITIANAGTINGNVLLDQVFLGSHNSNRYFALAGGILNGDLLLTNGAMLITDLADGTPGRFTGITGTILGENAELRYRVRNDATATLDRPAPFSVVGYDLFDDAVLTLAGAATTVPVTFAGQGSVDLTADISSATESLITLGSVQFAPGETRVTDSNALAITSRGTLTLTRADSTSYYPFAAVALGRGDSFVNAGTIVATSLANPVYSRFSAIGGGKDVTNSGTITLDGAIGVQGAVKFTNSGTIVQAAGGRTATGINSVAMLVNSGTIDVAGIAIDADYSNGSSIENSGRIFSSGDVAINGSMTEIINLANGTIAGVADGNAIQISGGTISNAGAIFGSVDLGYGGYGRSYNGAFYLADGGTIAGDLRFGQGNDTLLAFGEDLGVSGMIDGGDGTDTLIHARRATGTVTLGATPLTGFEREGVRALGADTVLTIRAEAPFGQDILLSGDGTILNTATIDAAARTPTLYGFSSPTRSDTNTALTAFINQSDIAGGVFGTIQRFTNSGTIGTGALANNGVAIDNDPTLDFVNDGAIVNDGSRTAVLLAAFENIVISNSGTITGGGLSADALPYYYYYQPDRDIIPTVTMTNSGTVATTALSRTAVQLSTSNDYGIIGAVTLDNSGTIDASGQGAAGVYLTAAGYVLFRAPILASAPTMTVTNSGTIRANGGGIPLEESDPYANGWFRPAFTQPASAISTFDYAGNTLALTNTADGLIEATGVLSSAIFVTGAALDLTNAGTIRGGAGTSLTSEDGLASYPNTTYLAGAIHANSVANDRIVNTGAIFGSIDLGAGDDRIDNLGRIEGDVFLRDGNDTFLQRASAVLIGTVDAGAGDDGLIVDATEGGALNGDQFVNFERFSQIGTGTVAYSGTFRFDTVGQSGGTVTVAAGQTLASGGAVTITGSDAAETVLNDGTIAGSVLLAGGDDRVVNRGAILGSVALGDGADSFVDGAGSSVTGGVDGGAGIDRYTVTLAGDRNGIGARTGFETLAIDGTGTLALTLDQRFDSVSLSGTGLTVALNGYTLGPVTGSDAAETLTTDGDLAAVTLGGGNDALALGSTRATGAYTGGTGVDTLRLTVTGPVTLAGTATGFEQVALAGSALSITGRLGTTGDTLGFGDGAEQLTVADGGTLAGTIDLGAGDDTLALATTATLAGTVTGGLGTDTLRFLATGPATFAGTATGFEQVVLAGSTLAVAGRLGTTGDTLGFGDGAQQLTVADGGTLDGTIDLGAGDDTLALATTATLAGTVTGGLGTDTLRFLTTGPATFAGTATGFEQVALAGSTLAVTGRLGTTGDTLGFGDGAQQLTVADGGTLAGTIDLGAGDDGLRLAANAGLDGTVSGGAGTDGATLLLAGGYVLASGTLRDFEILTTEGSGTLTLTGSQTYARVASAGNLTLASGGILTAPQVQFGAGDDRFVIAGRFSGAVDGGAGTDSIALSGGTATDPVAFAGIANVESYAQTGGQATMSGTAMLGSVDLSGGRLIGLAGSTLSAAQIAVRQGATFGSAGTVNGALTVAGTLSPGASPGTMTVNGAVALAATSVSLFELTPTVSDQLRVNGAVSIATGATLRIVQDGALRPGASYDLIVASGGITGSFTTVAKPDTLFGFVVQRADRIQLLGQFLNDAGFSPQVSRSVAYANATLAVQPATSALFAALPALLTGSGASNPRAFAQLTPEAYASASQIGTDNALALGAAARGPGFAPTRTDAGLFTFAQMVGQWQRLGDDAGQGTSAARTRSYGFLGGLGYGDVNGSIGAFGGYLNSRQTIGALGAQTKADGFVAGVHGRYTQGGFGLTASLLYNGGDADTVRALPGTGTATGRADLRSWVGDLSVGYGIAMGADWALRPKVGITYLRTTRAGLVESGSAFALTVARDRHVAGFADAALGFGRSETSPAAFRPYVSIGTRYQIEGLRADALAGYAGGGLGLTALGAARARLVGTAAAGLSYRFATGLDLFTTASAQTGRDDHQESITTGVRLRF